MVSEFRDAQRRPEGSRLVPVEVDDELTDVKRVGPRRQEFADSRRRAGVHERTFLQPTPMGDLVIVTLEGDDPGRAFGQMMGATDAFTSWFLERAKAIHGVDLTVPMTGSPSELVLDTAQVAAPAR